MLGLAPVAEYSQALGMRTVVRGMRMRLDLQLHILKFILTDTDLLPFYNVTGRTLR